MSLMGTRNHMQLSGCCDNICDRNGGWCLEQIPLLTVYHPIKFCVQHQKDIVLMNNACVHVGVDMVNQRFEICGWTKQEVKLFVDQRSNWYPGTWGVLYGGSRKSGYFLNGIRKIENCIFLCGFRKTRITNIYYLCFREYLFLYPGK